jgi:crotonobetainyl-CoA:carnitine CoA-transferase CaiB-like acyl-CoA transferase
LAVPEKAKGMLSPYRVLDLADEKGIFCGKVLGDLGADVIKIEPPGGSSCRNQGPFYHDEPNPEKSLFWFAYNVNKRGITLNIETNDGQDIFRRLVRTADLVIESFMPGYMDNLGLGYSHLEKVNPRLIMVSITPFGQTGPYKDYKAPDIVAFAMGGRMYPTGDDDRSPLRISHHSQSYLHAGAEGAVGAMLALYHRETKGEGQHVDVSVQASVAPLFQYSNYWDALKFIPQRVINPPIIKQTWPCKDGYVVWGLWGGGPNARRFNMPLFNWMENEGIEVNFLKEYDWENWDTKTVTQEEANRLQAPVAKFFLSHTRLELLEGAVKHHIMLCPLNTTEDVLHSVQLEARHFWVELEHHELGVSITYPGPFIKSSLAHLEISRRAPLVGEHNREIYEEELGLSGEEILYLRQAGVI